jgi:hypothetical protein
VQIVEYMKGENMQSAIKNYLVSRFLKALERKRELFIVLMDV